jgi:AbrB family looped-hinge helix DNA binding protein
VMSLTVEVGRCGRLILPKNIREKCGVKEGSRLIAVGFEGRIILVPVKVYDKPTEALYRSVELERLVDEPKSVARAYIREKIAEGIAPEERDG